MSIPHPHAKIKNRVHEPFVMAPWRLWAEGHVERMGPSGFLVWMTLLYHAGSSGRAWPSRRTLARETGLSESTVARALANLRELGYIEVVEQRPGETTVYAVAIPEAAADERTRVKMTQDQCQNDTGTRVKLTHELDKRELYKLTPPKPPPTEQPTTPGGGHATPPPSGPPSPAGPVAQAVAAIAPGALSRRVTGRDYSVLERLPDWERMWTPAEVRAAWEQAKRDAHNRPLSLFWLILEGEVPLDHSLVERPPQQPSLPDSAYRYIGIDDVPDPLEVLYGKQTETA